VGVVLSIQLLPIDPRREGEPTIPWLRYDLIHYDLGMVKETQSRPHHEIDTPPKGQSLFG
jgi:hypothetical protein